MIKFVYPYYNDNKFKNSEGECNASFFLFSQVKIENSC